MDAALEFAVEGPLRLLGDRDRRTLLERGRRVVQEARLQVTPIWHDVRDHGDDALRRLTKRFDGVELERLHVETTAWKRAVAAFPKGERAALERAAARIEAYHALQLPRPYEVTLDGVRLGWKPVPLERVGVYVPGGQASYPSSLLMGAIPARVAGVRDIMVCTPPRKDGTVHPALLAAADIAGVKEVVRVGGAQAVFAMAFGTRSVRPVQKVVGPGNVFVQAAKQLVSGWVGTDALAGPSEVLVVADGAADPRLAAWELAAQAEHDIHATSVCVTTDEAFLGRVRAELARLVPAQARADVIRAALARQGALLHTPRLEEALRFANEFAPEHLVLLTADPEAALAEVRTAGSVFLGPRSPVAFGDYGAGTNHVLPTSGTAHFSSGLGVLDFLRYVQWQEVLPEGLATVGPDVQRLAELEGLSAHAGAVAARAGPAPGKVPRPKPARPRRRRS